MIKFSNKTYDALKWLCLIFSPALCTLISTIAGYYGKDVTIVTGIINAITVFIGALIGISTSNFNKEGDGNE